MAFAIHWTHRARNDLRELRSFIAQDDPRAAEGVVERISDTVDLLEAQPLLGRRLPERPHPALREIVEGNYRIIYHVSEPRQRLTIRRVWHGARGTPRLESF